METAYLIEPSHVSNTGKLQGKSLRTYEVFVENKVDKYGTKRPKVTPTGVCFTIDNDKIIQKKTKAKLTDKYLSYRESINYTMPKGNVYGCSLFSTPELALHYKATLVRTNSDKVIDMLQTSLASALSLAPTIKDTSFIVAQHPELFI